MVETFQNEVSSWPAKASAYKLLTPIGMGSFGLVWKAKCTEGANSNKDVAIKVIDLEQFQDSSIEEIRKEISIMSICFHKNIVSCYVSFIQDSDLWVVMPILGAGSCADIMKVNCPGGIKNEATIATILSEIMQGLQYFHMNGSIHRDIKAGNILMDMEGNVYISDFGVSASLKKGQKRKTFVGSPCWMAPEVMEQTGHDFAADIWSLGITAIELAEGEAPYCNLPAMKVLMTIIKDPPPNLAKTEKWDQSFRDFVSACLQKDPSKRPTIEELFAKHKKFLSKAKNAQYLKQNLLGDLKEVYLRKDAQLDSQAQEYLDKKSKGKAKKQGKSKTQEMAWDFGDEEESSSQQQQNDKKKVKIKIDENKAKEVVAKKGKQTGQVNSKKSKDYEDDGLFDDLGD